MRVCWIGNPIPDRDHRLMITLYRRRCAHCDAPTFGWRKLSTMDARPGSACTECGAWSRNSWPRDLIPVLTCLAATFIAMTVLHYGRFASVIAVAAGVLTAYVSHAFLAKPIAVSIAERDISSGA